LGGKSKLIRARESCGKRPTKHKPYPGIDSLALRNRHEQVCTHKAGTTVEKLLARKGGAKVHQTHMPSVKGPGAEGEHGGTPGSVRRDNRSWDKGWRKAAPKKKNELVER